MEPPLLYGGGQADDPDQQEVEVLKVLLSHLQGGRRREPSSEDRRVGSVLCVLCVFFVLCSLCVL